MSHGQNDFKFPVKVSFAAETLISIYVQVMNGESIELNLMSNTLQLRMHSFKMKPILQAKTGIVVISNKLFSLINYHLIVTGGCYPCKKKQSCCNVSKSKFTESQNLLLQLQKCFQIHC